MSDACTYILTSELWVGGEIKRGQTTLVPSTVVSAKAMDTFGSLLGKISEELCGETVEKVTISSLSKADCHIVPLGAPVVEVSFIRFNNPCVLLLK